jgi:hypothetical protein
LHQLVATSAGKDIAANPAPPEDVVKMFTNKGADDLSHSAPDGRDYLQYDEQSPQYTGFPQCYVGNRSGCLPWPKGEWFTIYIRLKPGHTSDDQLPKPNMTGGQDEYNSLRVLTPGVDAGAMSPAFTNSGTKLVFETPLPPLFPYLATSRLSPGYFTGWTATWPSSSGGATWPVNNYPGTGKTQVESAVVVNGRMRWTLVKLGINDFPTTLPTANDWMQVVPASSQYHPSESRDTVLEMALQKADGSIHQVYRMSDKRLMFGDNGENVYSFHPPAFNSFQPTGYTNINDNLAPADATWWYRYDQVIFSKNPIPWPSL